MNFLTKPFPILLLLVSLNCFSQIKIVTSKTDTISILNSKKQALTVIITAKPDIISHWTNKNVLGIDISQIAFVIWNAGGTSSITGLLKGDIIREYKDDYQVWANELIFKYGMNKQKGTELRKTDDVFKINSTFIGGKLVLLLP